MTFNLLYSLNENKLKGEVSIMGQHGQIRFPGRRQINMASCSDATAGPRFCRLRAAPRPAISWSAALKAPPLLQPDAPTFTYWPSDMSCIDGLVEHDRRTHRRAGGTQCALRGLWAGVDRDDRSISMHSLCITVTNLVRRHRYQINLVVDTSDAQGWMDHPLSTPSNSCQAAFICSHHVRPIIGQVKTDYYQQSTCRATLATVVW